MEQAGGCKCAESHRLYLLKTFLQASNEATVIIIIKHFSIMLNGVPRL